MIAMHEVTLVTPNYARVLVRDLSMSLPKEGRILVIGPSGCGKTSLLRALGGLWTAGVGSIATPPVASAAVCNMHT
jgi:putative ATP-binding cassette transporter